MYCSNCGAACSDQAAFCPSCGASLRSVANASAKVNPYQVASQPVASPVVEVSQTSAASVVSGSSPAQPSLGMTWMTVMRVFLVIGALSGLANGICYITGLAWEMQDISVNLLYRAYPAMHIGDIVSGVLFIVAAAVDVLTVVWLTKRKKQAVLLATWVYAFNAIVSLISSAIISAIIGDFTMLGTAVPGVVVAVVMTIINKKYYEKRKQLFVN